MSTIDPLHAFNINIATVAIRHVGEPRPNYCARKNCIMAAALLTGYSLAIADRASKERYEAKIQQIDGVDPYEIPLGEWSEDLEDWPSITHVHACMYLILTPSPYSDKDMLNYKSLDSYRNFVKGWVRCVLVKKVGDKRLVAGKVNHSQKLAQSPLIPWIVAKKDGQILLAHCNCMAGLGESCTHVASLLWVIASGVQRIEGKPDSDRQGGILDQAGSN